MKRLLTLPRLTSSDVSRHRNALYGISALWILLYHMNVFIPAHPLFAPLRWFKEVGMTGVDIFVLLTGMGLYRSMSKSPSLRSFYGRRFVRVALPTILSTLLFAGLYELAPAELIAKLLIFPYWFNVPVKWYSAFILTMYLLYPLIFRIQQKQPMALWFLFGLSVILAALPSLLNFTSFNALLGVERLPVFMLSCIIAPHLNGDRPVPRWIFPASLAAYILLNVTLHPMQTQDPFPFFTCTLLLAVCMIILCLHLLKLFRWALLHRALNFFGSISLEMYLIYGHIERIVRGIISSRSISSFCAALLTIPASYLLRRLCVWLISMPSHRASQ